MTALKQIVIFLLVWNHLVVGIPLDDFYPFGSGVFDTLILPNDDGSSAGIPLTLSFPFFDSDHDMLFVNNNGAVSFTVAVSQFTPDPFPLSGSLELIAPYWADVDTREIGIPNNVWYRQTTDATLLARAQDMIQAAFINQGSFVPDYIFIATWDHVGYFNRHTDRTNTFQCVLVTNGISSFVIFLYADGGIQWTTGDASSGSGGLGGTPAQVGFNAGDGLRFANVPGSRTADIINIDTTSNVGVPGVWIFRVDEEDVAVGGCQNGTNATITLAPRVGSVLGGTAVLVSGPCLQEDDNITCIFDGEEVEGSYLSEMLAVCITPPFSSIGRVTFQLIVEGNGRIAQGTETFFSAPYDRSFIQLDHPSMVFDAGDNCTLTWTPSSIVPLADPMSYTVDIGLYCIEESTGVVNEIATLENGIPNSGMATVNIPESISYSSDVCSAFILISPSGNGTGMITRRQTDTTVDIVQLLVRRGIRLGLWSGIRYIIISAALRLSCEAWCAAQPVGIGDNLLMEVEPCPPTAIQARQDTRFAEDNPLAVAIFHSGASTCFRQVVMNREGEDCLPGSQCCYDEDGELITGPPSGGTVDIASPQGSIRCYLQHFFQDVLPSIYCCIGLFPDCQSYYQKRPSVPETGYVPPVPAFMFGDPHLVTLDGLMYTFNGQGEYILVETADNSFLFQGRMEAATDVNGNPALGTIFSAVVATQDDSDTVQFEVSRRGLDVLVDGVRVDFEGIPEQDFNNVTVSDLGNNTFSARFSDGGYIEAQEANDIILFLFFRLPNSYQGQTRGLLGNFNGDTSDDLVPQFGNQSISTDSSLQEIHEMFGVTWIIDNPGDSLFTYGPGENLNTFFNPGFTPAFQPIFNDPVLAAEATALCQGDFFCLFDAATTGSIDIGLSTLASSEVFDMILNLSTPIVCDPPCENGACVANDTCNCAEGYIGDRCTEQVFGTCDQNPCENGGTCSFFAGSFLCDCPPFFSGSLCGDELDPCDPDPCDMNAICNGIGGNPVCTCIPPYIGDGTTCRLPSISDGGGDDPHFSIALPGGKLLCYTVQGEHGFAFNLISNKKVFMNAMFVPDSRREEVTWLGSMGIIVKGTGQKDNMTALRFQARENKIYVNDKVVLDARNIEMLTFRNGKLTISEAPPVEGFKQPRVHVDLVDVGLSFCVDFMSEHLDLLWHSTGQRLKESHGIIGQFFRKGVEIDEVRKLLILPGKEPVPVMRRPVWSYMERETPDDQLCWTAMNPGYQGEGLIDGTYYDYLVNDVLSTNFKFKKQ